MRVRGSVYESSAQSLARSQQIQQDTLKREQEARSTAASLRSKFHASCQEMGIQVGSSPPHHLMLMGILSPFAGRGREGRAAGSSE